MLFFFAFITTTASADESSVYSCRFKDDAHGFYSVRMKKYFDAQANMDLGKVDLIQNFIVVESTTTKVYQIPLLDNQTYVQLWYSPSLRVDAPLSYTQGTQEFQAHYLKNSERKEMICVELRN